MRFKFIDRVVSFKKGEKSRIVTVKTFPRSDEFIEGHPLRPGEIPTCLILETLANAGVHLVFSHMDGRVVGILLRVEEAKILSKVFAGEEVTVSTELIGIQPEAQRSVGLARTLGSVSVGDRQVAEARLVLLCFPKDGFEASLPW